MVHRAVLPTTTPTQFYLNAHLFFLAVLQLLQEVLATHLAGVPSKRVSMDAPFYQHALSQTKIDSKALKMAFYGFFVSAPLGHFLVGALQKVFAGKNDLKSKVTQILASNLLVAPIQISGMAFKLLLRG